jgi:hypothetical protein
LESGKRIRHSFFQTLSYLDPASDCDALLNGLPKLEKANYRHPQEKALYLTDARNDWDSDTCTTMVVGVGGGVGMQLLYIPLGKEETCSSWVKG